MDYTTQRKGMVDEQLIPRGISDKRVLDVFYSVERHKFIPEEQKEFAYSDFPIPIGQGQTISQPYIVALMTEALALTDDSKVLEIGTGSGYQAAILAKLAKEVYSIERFPNLAKNAQTLLDGLGYKNIKIKVADGTLGWPEEAPFDRIIITAAAPSIPAPLIEQLKEGGRLILPLGENFSQVLTLAEKKGGELYSQNICGCVFVPLVGKFGLFKKE
jgi:protein-L-isoaspartate(D-aspartate) O-methyltransferase